MFPPRKRSKTFESDPESQQSQIDKINDAVLQFTQSDDESDGLESVQGVEEFEQDQSDTEEDATQDTQKSQFSQDDPPDQSQQSMVSNVSTAIVPQSQQTLRIGMHVNLISAGKKSKGCGIYDGAPGIITRPCLTDKPTGKIVKWFKKDCF